MKAFTKGEAVTHFYDWDRKGTIAFRHCVVYSCGTKLMVLTDAKTMEEVGRTFQPVLASGDELGTRKRLSDEEAVELCFTLGAAVVKEQRERFASCIERNSDFKAYVERMKNDIAALHEPRMINRTGEAI